MRTTRKSFLTIALLSTTLVIPFGASAQDSEIMCTDLNRALYNECIQDCRLGFSECTETAPERFRDFLRLRAKDCDALVYSNATRRSAFRRTTRNLRRLGILSKKQAKNLRLRLAECNKDNQNSDDPTNNGSVLVCHIPPGNPLKSAEHLLPESAVSGHLKHGDVLGICPAKG
ncbi:MAG: hypothetical protein KDD53_07130 [Bdellovibrionales bacterium]|nr:hypothetical protein [Bdellovibrionales bacterium]